MKTLILNGSPRKNGNTISLIRRLTDKLNGDILVVDAYSGDVSPCIDCRYCKDHPGCAIDDGMQKVYRYIESCDSIVIASPIYFNELTGRLLDVVSRAQMYFCASHFRNEKLIDTLIREDAVREITLGLPQLEDRIKEMLLENKSGIISLSEDELSESSKKLIKDHTLWTKDRKSVV